MLEMNVNIDLTGIDKKLSEANLDKGQKAMANQMLGDIDNFVPYREGSLSSKATISLDGKELHYNEPYAKRMYYGDLDWNWTVEKHPLAGPGWDKVASEIFMEDWKQAYVDGAELN